MVVEAGGLEGVVPTLCATTGERSRCLGERWSWLQVSELELAGGGGGEGPLCRRRDSSSVVNRSHKLCARRRKTFATMTRPANRSAHCSLSLDAW